MNREGVITFITDPTEFLFLLERKDSCCPEYGGKLGLWGGFRDFFREMDHDVLKRELNGEIADWAWKILSKEISHLNVFPLGNESSQVPVSVYKSIVGISDLYRMKAHIDENNGCNSHTNGYKIIGEIVTRPQLPGLPYIHDLHTVIDYYLKNTRPKIQAPESILG